MHCRRYLRSLNRREMLQRCANGFGSLALAGLFGQSAAAAEPQSRVRTGTNPLQVLPPHFEPKVKNVIFLFMDGGPSQIDTFDPKPRLAQEHGKPIPLKDVPPTQFNNVGKLLQSPWKFRQYGESGTPVSELFPHVAEHVDEMAIVRSMVSDFSEHTNANYFIHTGFGLQGRPSMGSWVTYGLGSEANDLPGFVVINTGLIPPGGLDCFNSGFLPASYQGSVFKPGSQPVANLRAAEKRPGRQQRKLALLDQLDDASLEAVPENDALESAVANYELAFRMQTAVPEVADLGAVTPALRKLYGLDDKPTQRFGQGCLLARRLIERGVRFVEVLCPPVGHDRWDQHGNLKKGHEDNAQAVDRPIAGLLTDLKQSGLWDDTLVIWGGEFGRTPMAQGSNGRDHNPFGFTMWLAGGGIRGGTIYGATDDYGYFAIKDKVHIHDLHATMLHLLGLDHTKLTFRFSGRDMRLTDVHGEIVHGILA